MTNMEGDSTSTGAWRGDASSRFSFVFLRHAEPQSRGTSAGNVDFFALFLKESTAVERGLHLPKVSDMPGSVWLIMSGSVWLSQVGRTTATTKILLGVSVRLFSEQLN